MHVERFKQGIEIVENITKDFDMNYWFARFSGCGTVACAAGHIAQDPRSIADGFILSRQESSIPGCTRPWQPFYNGKFGMEAIMEYYDISQRTAVSIFDSFGYDLKENEKITPSMVASKMKTFLEMFERGVEGI